jgi:hypothetical protein
MIATQVVVLWGKSAWDVGRYELNTFAYHLSRVNFKCSIFKTAKIYDAKSSKVADSPKSSLFPPHKPATSTHYLIKEQLSS